MTIYATIRRYKIITGEKERLNKLVKNEFVPLISGLPGFVAYYGIDAGADYWASLSVFDTKAGSEESNKMAADWVKKNVANLVGGPVEITAGDVVAHKTMEFKAKAA
jgi:hypothetical protein